MPLGFVFESARSKRPSDDAPTQERMQGKGQRRRPDADQKKVRRQMLRTEHDQRRTASLSEVREALTAYDDLSMDAYEALTRIEHAVSGRTDQAGLYIQHQVESVEDLVSSGHEALMAIEDYLDNSTATATKENTIMSESFQQREAALLRRMTASNDLSEQRRLAEELEQVRSERTASLAEERAIDLADTMIRDTFTPVAVHERHTAATDWVLEQQTGGYDQAAADHDMRTKATLWFEALIDEVKADHEEFSEQARGVARREAGVYGEDAIIVAQAFLDTAERLRTQAGYKTAASGMPHSTPEGGQNGQGESTVTNYDAAPPDDKPFDDDFWEGGPDGGASGVHPSYPGAGEKDEQHVTSSRYDGVSGKPGDTATCSNCNGGLTAASGSGTWLHDSNGTMYCPGKTAPSETDESFMDYVARPKTAAKTAIMVRNVGIEGDNGVGTTEDGTRITFRLSDKDRADLKAVLYSDLAMNFSGVEIEQSDIISEQGGGNSMTGPSRSAGFKTARAIHEIADEIKREWKDVNYAAKPYLDAMMYLSSIDDKVGEDEGKWIIAYFLNNAASFRGEAAKRLKDELKAIQKGAAKTADRDSGTCSATYSGKDAGDEDRTIGCDKDAGHEGRHTHKDADGDTWEWTASRRTAGEVPESFKQNWDKGDGDDADTKDESDEGKPWEKGATKRAYYDGDTGAQAVCHADGLPIEMFDGAWYHLKGGPQHNDVYPASPREQAEKDAASGKSASLDMWDDLDTSPGVAPSGPQHTSGLIGLSAQGALQRLADDSGNGQNGNADSGLPDEPTGDASKVMWPVELPGDSEDPKTGEDAANVAAVPTPGGESGYPQPKSSSLTEQQAAFRATVQANLR